MRQPVYFISHGTGPCFFMEWKPSDLWQPLRAWLERHAGTLPRHPDGVVSAHWESEPVAVNGNHRSDLLFDYYGFPRHTHALRHPAPGNDLLAQRVERLLRNAAIPTRRDDLRRLDHGVFVPLLVVFPNADVPVVQVSLRRGLDARAHLEIGRALAPLAAENVLLLGSGQAFHNMQAYASGDVDHSLARAFDEWLTETVQLDDWKLRWVRLCEWTLAPAARYAHPREEHLLPLLFAAGVAGDTLGRRVHANPVMGLPMSAYRFG